MEEELKEGVDCRGTRIVYPRYSRLPTKIRRNRSTGRRVHIFTLDIVALYPMVPRKEAEAAMRKILERKKTKTIPTEDLMELTYAGSPYGPGPRASRLGGPRAKRIYP